MEATCQSHFDLLMLIHSSIHATGSAPGFQSPSVLTQDQAPCSALHSPDKQKQHRLIPVRHLLQVSCHLSLPTKRRFNHFVFTQNGDFLTTDYNYKSYRQTSTNDFSMKFHNLCQLPSINSKLTKKSFSKSPFSISNSLPTLCHQSIGWVNEQCPAQSTASSKAAAGLATCPLWAVSADLTPTLTEVTSLHQSQSRLAIWNSWAHIQTQTERWSLLSCYLKWFITDGSSHIEHTVCVITSCVH